MTRRDTDTGGVLESMILPALRRGEYTVRTQVVIGQRIGRGRHKIDAIATKGERSVLVSLKWQQVGGTAEQKVPFEVICLAEALRTDSAAFGVPRARWRGLAPSGVLRGWRTRPVPSKTPIGSAC